MQHADFRPTYPSPMKFFHWLVALLVIGMLGLGLYMDWLPRDHPDREMLYLLHKSIGVSVLVLVILRVLTRLRLRSHVPAPAPTLKKWEIVAAGAVHLLLYLALLAMPVTGLWMSQAYGFPVQWFGFPVPNIFPKNLQAAELAGEVHEWIAYGLIGLIGLHVGAVIKHRFIDKADILYRMLPRR